MPSPMRRALLTALPFARVLDLDPESFWCHGELYEVGGCYAGDCAHPGSTGAELEAEFPVRFVGEGGGGWYAGRQGRESEIEAARRVERIREWLERTLDEERARRDTVVVVAHGDLLTRWLRRWLDVPWHAGLAFVHGNTAITELRWEPGRGLLVLGFNDLGHLPLEDRSGVRVPDVWWRYAMPELVVERHRGRAEVDGELWRELIELRAPLLEREGASIDRYEESDQRNVHLVAWVRGEVAGTAQYDPVHGRLRQVIVAPALRGGRVGRALVEAARREAARDSRRELAVHAWEESVGFYRALGFEPTGEVIPDAVPWQPLVIPADSAPR